MASDTEPKAFNIDRYFTSKTMLRVELFLECTCIKMMFGYTYS